MKTEIKTVLKGAFLTTLLVAVFGPSLAFAQDGGAAATEAAAGVTPTLGRGLAVLGAGLAVVGGAIGIGLVGKAAAESTARQPEAGNQIFLIAIILAAFIEGATLFAVAAGFLSN